jgi:hypothetical protein
MQIATRIAITSLEALAADTVGTTVMGFDQAMAPYLSFINQGGFGQGNISEIKIFGTPSQFYITINIKIIYT